MAILFTLASSQNADVSTASISAYPLTMAAWFNPNVNASTQCIIGMGSGIIIEIDLRASGVVRGFCGSAVDSAINTYTTGVWQHATFVCRSATDKELYYNGASVATNVTNNPFAAEGFTYIGARYAGAARSQFLDGAMAEAGIWNVALTVAEIGALAKGVPPSKIRPGSLQNYYHAWDATSPVLNFGKGGSTYNLTTVNTPTQQAHPPFVLPDTA